MFCTQCGTQTQDEAQFCQSCGHKLMRDVVSAKPNGSNELAFTIPIGILFIVFIAARKGAFAGFLAVLYLAWLVWKYQKKEK
jgi:uncharacterized membrane protein YvbJ